MKIHRKAWWCLVHFARAGADRVALVPNNLAFDLSTNVQLEIAEWKNCGGFPTACTKVRRVKLYLVEGPVLGPTFLSRDASPVLRIVGARRNTVRQCFRTTSWAHSVREGSCPPAVLSGISWWMLGLYALVFSRFVSSLAGFQCVA